MDAPVTIIISAQSLGLLALAYRLGKYAQRFENNEERIEALEESKTDVALAKVGEQVTSLQTGMERIERELQGFSTSLMRWMERRASATAGGD